LKFFYNNEEYNFTSNNLLNSCIISIPNVKEESYQFVVQFLLDICCIPHVDKASINEIYYEEVPVKAPANANANATNTTNEKKEGENQEKKEEQKPEPPKTEKVKRERSNVCMLKIAECNYGNPQSVLDNFFSKEANQENEDNIYKATITRRNEIENNIYSTRIKMQDELAAFITQEEKAALPPLMDEAEAWLYSGDEEVYNKNSLETKCGNFNELCVRIYGRFNNWRNLDQAINFLDEYNANNMNKINQICDSDLKRFLNQEELFNLIANSNKNLNDLKAQLQKTPKFMDPPVTSDKLKGQYDELNNKLNKIYNDAENKQKEEQRKIEKEKKDKEAAEKKAAEEAKKTEAKAEEKSEKKAEDKMDIE
jgi:nitrogen fixation-related uncharacterized protein